mgnify:CR=1 FL=1
MAELTKSAEIPIVLDADGINSLCPNIDVLLKKKSTVILTPHPAELARLCGVTVGEVMSDRPGFAYRLSEKYGVTVLAKSADTFAVGGEKFIFAPKAQLALGKGRLGGYACRHCFLLCGSGVQRSRCGCTWVVHTWLDGSTCRIQKI